MALRHATAGFIEAEKGFRRIKGYRQLPLLMAVLSSGETETVKTITLHGL